MARWVDLAHQAAGLQMRQAGARESQRDLRRTEDAVVAYAPPDNVRFASTDRLSEFEGGATIRSPSHFEDPSRTLDPFHSQAWAKGPARAKVLNEPLYDRSKSPLRAPWHGLVITFKTPSRRPSRHVSNLGALAQAIDPLQKRG